MLSDNNRNDPLMPDSDVLSQNESAEPLISIAIYTAQIVLVFNVSVFMETVFFWLRI